MKAIKWLWDNLEEVLISILLVLISVIMLFQFTFRIFGNSIVWSDEACRYMFIWSVGLGVPYATKRGAHLRMDIIPNLLPKTAPVFEIICDLSLMFVSVWMLWPGMQVIQGIMAKGQLGASTRIPMWIVYSAFFVGFALSIIRLIEKYGRRLINLKKTKEA